MSTYTFDPDEFEHYSHLSPTMVQGKYLTSGDIEIFVSKAADQKKVAEMLRKLAEHLEEK